MSSRIHEGGRIMVIALLAGTLLLPGARALAGELLPFPAAPSLRQPAREAPYLARYRKKIRPLRCRELQDLRDGLLRKVRAATGRDRRYYMSLVHVVDDVRDSKTCP
ncbi:MAG TPA: hypothetical protein ENK27_10290 [Desulfobulbus sp.]|nr:hypothetical protein [Desulfobulbus sp.]